MIKIVLKPDLDHCIQTLAKKEYEKISGRLLSGEMADTRLQKKLEMLAIMLKELDFAELRRQSELYLAQGKKVTFVFYMKSGLPGYEMHIG